jgi:hypothetical protein
MRRFLLCVALLTVVGCSGRDKPVQQITPGSRVIYYGGVAVFAVCDRGNTIYLVDKSPQIFVVPGGCPTGSP